MSQSDNNTSESLTFLLFALCAVIFGSVVWVYFHYSNIIFGIMFPFTAICVLFSIFIMLNYRASYSISDFRSWYTVIGPCLVILISIYIVLQTKKSVDLNLVELAQQQKSKMAFTFFDLSSNQSTMGFRHFMALLLTLFSQIWCAIALLNYVATHFWSEGWRTVANLTDTISTYVGVAFFIFILALLLR
jgi:hypothetical protein